MTGVEYWRMKKHISAADLAAKADVGVTTVFKMERAFNPTALSGPFIRLADAMDVPVDYLLKEYDPSTLKASDRVTYRWKNKPLDIANCIACYRHEENYSLQQLGDILGVTRERARVICNEKEAPRKHVAALAKKEGISVEEFHLRYDPEEVAAA